MFRLRLNPTTAKRLKRFRRTRRAWWSFWLLGGIFVLSLGVDFLANDKPLVVSYDGKLYFPVFRYFPEDTFTGSGRRTRPDYKEIARSEAFAGSWRNWMLFPPIPFGPAEKISPDAVEAPDRVLVTVEKRPRVASLNVDAAGKIVQSLGAAVFFGGGTDAEVAGRPLREAYPYGDEVAEAIAGRMANREMPEAAFPAGVPGVEIAFSAFRPRSRPPTSVRVGLRDRVEGPEARVERFAFGPGGEMESASAAAFWERIPEADRERLRSAVRERFEVSQDTPVAPLAFAMPDGNYQAKLERETVFFPFRPVKHHPMGIDSSGRDVFVQILYATRVSLLFGIALVVGTEILGVVVGAVQGYFGGRLDMFGQRFIEIWESLPFLYVMMLLGSVFGRGFFVLLVAYGIFNWVGISYYIRGEFLKLRKLPFVESARVMGIPRWKIMFRHILPNALVPLITFFPFSLVGAIGSLAALDFLGFGLPPGTPSWGQLLSQGQEFPYAWWLILYPTLALFVVILLGVFVGEGVRNAFDPRSHSKLQ
jgi:microcin C transport system permease protein